MIVLIDALSTRAECNKYEGLNLPEITEGRASKAVRTLARATPGRCESARAVDRAIRKPGPAPALSLPSPHRGPHASAHPFKVRLTLALLRSRRRPEDMSPYVLIAPESVP
jgi:hypothetical protein